MPPPRRCRELPLDKPGRDCRPHDSNVICVGHRVVRGNLDVLPVGEERSRLLPDKMALEYLHRLGLDPVDGHLYLFLNKRRRIAKALWFDGSGWCVLAKRLEAGSFQIPPLPHDATQVQIDGVAFASLLAGIDFTVSRPGWFRRLPAA